MISCKNKASRPHGEIIQEVASLQEGNTLKKYLEGIFFERQMTSSKTKTATQQHGESSPQLKAIKDERFIIDQKNDIKIEQILMKFGYPDHREYGKLAALVPWMVIHQSKNMKLKERYFEMIHDAYQNGDIDGDSYSLFLNRMYQMKNDKVFSMNKPRFTFEEEIQTLLEVLQ